MLYANVLAQTISEINRTVNSWDRDQTETRHCRVSRPRSSLLIAFNTSIVSSLCSFPSMRYDIVWALCGFVGRSDLEIVSKFTGNRDIVIKFPFCCGITGRTCGLRDAVQYIMQLHSNMARHGFNFLSLFAVQSVAATSTELKRWFRTTQFPSSDTIF